MVGAGRAITAVCLAVLFAGGGELHAASPLDSATTMPPAVRPVYKPREHTVEIWGGIGHPFNHAAFKRYWMRGPAAGFAVYLPTTDRVRIGVGAEATLFSFRAGNFLKYYPTVTPQVKDIVTLNVFLSLRRYFQPTARTSPYIGGEVGFTRITGAEYKAFVNNIRVTYYEVPDAFRLTGTLTLGIDHYISRRVAVQGEARLTYLHNDPNLSLMIGGRAGFKFTL